MELRSPVPLPSIAFALMAFVGMLALDFDFVAACAITGMWIGSLLLAFERAPEIQKTETKKQFDLESVQGLIENSATPMLVTQRNKIAFANASARSTLGRHMLGQDPRVVFRQPEAIALLAKDRSGRAIVRGLVRRQDIWAMNRQLVDDRLAIIELINQTAEADISRAHTDFVANASHELRTPLASILGYVETLAEGDEPLDAPMPQKFLGIIEREGKRLQSLISDLMSLSRIEAEKHDLPSEHIALAPLVRQSANDAAGADRTERLKVDIAFEPTVLGDRQQLEQLVRNLVDNALKYGSEDGPVTVTLDHGRERQARLTIEDNGDGISSEHLPHLTRRFYRTDPGRSRASGGTGLGLAIVKHIVERHRGRLDIESELGKGTRVIVRIPSVEESGDDVSIEQ